MHASDEARAHAADGRLALVVIDEQHAYFELPGLAPFRERVVAHTNELIGAAREAGCPVVLVRTQHARDRSTWTRNMLEDGQGFAFAGTREAAYVDELDTRGHDEVVKTRDDAFFGTTLHDRLTQLGVTTVLLCGVSTHSCVAQTATGAYARDLRAAVALDAVASDDAALAEALLAFLHTELRQPLLRQSDAVAALRAGALPGE